MSKEKEFSPDERVQSLLVRLQALSDTYEEDDIVGTAKDAKMFINQITVAYIAQRDRAKIANQEASEAREKLVVVQELIKGAKI